MTLRPCLDPIAPSRFEERTRVTICRPDGTVEIEGQARTQQPSGAVALVASGRVVETPPLFWVAQTPDRFMTQPASGIDYRHGRGVFRLLDYSAPPLYPLPRPALSGTAAEQAAQWVGAVRAHFQANTLVSAGGPVSYTETLDLLLAERALGSILHARGVVATNKVTLTPSRGGEPRNRHKLTDAMLADLPLATSADDGYDWTALLAYIRGGTAGATNRSDLNNLAREFYRIGHDAFNDPENPLNLPPFDALRDYLDTGIIPTAYAAELAVPASVLTNAAAYRAAFLTNLPQRAYTAALTLTAPARFENDPWLVFTAFGGGEYWLATPDGLPYPAPLGFHILPGSRYLASGHLASRPEGGQYLLVDSLQFLDAPDPSTVDTDNNLLVDSWEAFLYGRLGGIPFADNDGDNYSSLQEMLERTDPDHDTSRPSVAAIDLRPPQLYLTGLGGRNFRLDWQWPAFYQDRIGFFIDGTTDFGAYQRIINSVSGDNQGRYHTPVDATTHPPTYFYRAGMKLK